MDHLEGANYRDYSVAPKRRKRNEVVSGEEERAEEKTAEPAEPEKSEESNELMAETLRRLYNESAKDAEETAAETAEKAEDIFGEAAETAENAAETVENAAEAVKDEAGNMTQNIQEASRRRRTNRS